MWYFDCLFNYQVTATKAELDNALKLVKKAEKELDLLKSTMDEIDCALAELVKLADLDEYNDSVAVSFS